MRCSSAWMRAEARFVVVLKHRHNRLHDYGAIIDALGDEEDGTSGETRAVIAAAFCASRPGKAGHRAG